MTKAEKRELRHFLEVLEAGPSEGDVESERDAGFEAGKQCAYDNLKDEFGSLLDSLQVPRAVKSSRTRRR